MKHKRRAEKKVKSIEVNANDFAQGVYFYTFNIGDKQVTKKMTVK